MAVKNTWKSRELPVLKAAIRLLERSRRGFVAPLPTSSDIARDTGIELTEVELALHNLAVAHPPYVISGWDSTGQLLAVTEQGRRAADFGPEGLHASSVSPNIKMLEPVEDAGAKPETPRKRSTPRPNGDRTDLSKSARGSEHRPVRLFYSYSHRDEKFRERLEVHLSALRRQELIDEWHDHKITAGREWKNDIDDNLEAADVILLLVSPDFLASDYAYNKEFKRALERHKSDEARVVPVILRYSDWQETPIGELQALPPDGRPVAGRGDRAWMEVTKGLRQVIREIHKIP
jgi:hypothetical protein